MDKLKVFSMFSGIGGFEVGLVNSSYDFEVVGFSEIDKYAVSIYQKHFPGHKNYGDATKINTDDLPDFDLLVGGFPCFTGNTLVLTDKGSVPIKEIKIGDKVLTHKDNYHKVVNVMVKPYHNTGVKITVTNLDNDDVVEVTCTSDHPFYTKNNDDNFVFLEANQLTLNHNLYGYKNKVYRIKKIEYIRLAEEVYNLEVDTDNSYTANGLKCHNCQAFSVAGKQQGFNDTRGTLFFEIARILRDKRPRYFLLENVRGLLSHNKGETFQTILEVLTEMGYFVQWEVYNSKDYGVPQNRERVFIKGYLGRECRPEILCETGDSEKDNRKIKSRRDKKRTYTIYEDNDTLSGTLTSSGQQSGRNSIVKEEVDNRHINIVGNVYSSGHGSGKVVSDEGLCPTLLVAGDTQRVLTKDNRSINVEYIKKPVTKRKYTLTDDELEDLKNLLIESKEKTGLTNKNISEELGVKQSLVEHYFRGDKYWTIPDKKVWFELKKLLNITTDKFDDFITEYITVDGIYDQGNRLYNTDGLSPTLNTSNNTLIKTVDGCLGSTQANSHWNDGTYSPTLTSAAGMGGGHVPMIKYTEYDKELTNTPKDNCKIINEGNIYPSKGQSGKIYSINGISLTINIDGKTKILEKENEDRNIKVYGYTRPSKTQSTIVYDDNGLIGALCGNNKSQPKIHTDKGIEKVGNIAANGTSQGGHVYNPDGISPTLCSGDLHKNGLKILECETCQPVQNPDWVNKKQNGKGIREDGEPSYTLTATDRHGVYNGYRIRRLTPRECERLQAFPSDWTKYGKDDELISDTQRYKCCGNAVTTTVITYIINEMFTGSKID